jgi:lysophospholipase L1-like esterase
MLSHLIPYTHPVGMVVAVSVLLGLSVSVMADSTASFLRENERILIVGDSITNNGTYVRMVYESIKHYHPQGNIQVNGLGINGVRSDYQYNFTGDINNPTLVTIMLGMNNIIHYGYGKRDDEKIVNDYAKDMTAKIKSFQEKGADVVLLTPTLTDEAFSREFWELRGSRALLRKLAQKVKEISVANGAWYLPVQEEFEAYQDSLPTLNALRPDGVHPSALGQYKIARIIMEHLNFPGRLLKPTEQRKLSPSFIPLDIKVSLLDKFLGDQLSLKFESPGMQSVVINWSMDGRHGRETIQINKQLTWFAPLNQSDLLIKPGDHHQFLFSLSDGKHQHFYVLDLSGVPVLHLRGNKTAGQITSDDKRGEGSLVGTWSLEKYENGLFLCGEVYDDDIQTQSMWPWGRDNVTLWLDLRQGDRFAGIGFDEDVYQSIIAVQDKPAFACSLHPWQGQGMELASNVGGRKNDKGWQWNLYINHAFCEQRKFNINDYDYIGINFNIIDEDEAIDGKRQCKSYPYHKAKYEMFIYPNLMAIVDLKNQLKTDTAITQYLAR